MSTRNLDKMMVPKSVVAIGASVRAGSVGAAVTRNLLAGGFSGDIHLVNVKGGTIEGRPVLKSLAELPKPADLAVIMTPAETVPRLIVELGERGTRVAVVITAGAGDGATAREDNARWRKRILRAAQPICCGSSGRTASATPCHGSASTPASGRAASRPGRHRRGGAVGRGAGRHWPTGAPPRTSASRT